MSFKKNRQSSHHDEQEQGWRANKTRLLHFKMMAMRCKTRFKEMCAQEGNANQLPNLVRLDFKGLSLARSSNRKMDAVRLITMLIIIIIICELVRHKTPTGNANLLVHCSADRSFHTSPLGCVSVKREMLRLTRPGHTSSRMRLLWSI